jgi:hypothetical protein
MKPADPFPGLLHAFFYDRLVEQRNLSTDTVRSYRDTWRLFLRFVAARHQRAVASLTLVDLNATEVAAFLQHCERERGVSIGTRNCRLAALRGFFRFVAERQPTAIAQCTQVLQIPTKKGTKPAPAHLDLSEIEIRGRMLLGDWLFILFVDFAGFLICIRGNDETAVKPTSRAALLERSLRSLTASNSSNCFGSDLPAVVQTNGCRRQNERHPVVASSGSSGSRKAI